MCIGEGQVYRNSHVFLCVFAALGCRFVLYVRFGPVYAFWATQEEKMKASFGPVFQRGLERDWLEGCQPPKLRLFWYPGFFWFYLLRLPFSDLNLNKFFTRVVADLGKIRCNQCWGIKGNIDCADCELGLFVHCSTDFEFDLAPACPKAAVFGAQAM